MNIVLRSTRVMLMVLVLMLIPMVSYAQEQVDDASSAPTEVDGILVDYAPPTGEVANRCTTGWTIIQGDGQPDPDDPDREVTYDLTIPSDGQYELLIAAYGYDRNGLVHNAGMYAVWSVNGQESVTTIPDTMMAVITWQGPLTTDQQVSGIYRYGTYPDERYSAWGVTYQMCLLRVADLPTFTPTPSQTPLPTSTPTPSPTAENTATSTVTSTATDVPVSTATATPSATATAGLSTPVTHVPTETVTPTTTVVAGTATPTMTSTPCADDDPDCTTNIGQTPEPTVAVGDGNEQIYLPLIQRAGYDLVGVSWPWPGVAIVILLVIVIILFQRIRRFGR